MITKEAIDWLNCLKDIHEDDIADALGTWYKDIKNDHNEVIDMAIEALNHSEIPNSSDCIDRAEAQTAIQFAARRYTVAHEAHGEGHVVWSDNLISVTDAMNALREVPSAQPEPKSPLYYGDGYSEGKMVYDSAECPNCGYIYDEGDQVWGEPYCPHCGQALDWYMRGEQDAEIR